MAHIAFCDPIPYQHDPTMCQLSEKTTFSCTSDKLLVTIEPGSVDPGNKCKGNFQKLHFESFFCREDYFETQKI